MACMDYMVLLASRCVQKIKFNHSFTLCQFCCWSILQHRSKMLWSTYTLHPIFRIWGYVLHIKHVSCTITNYGQHQWVIPFPLLILGPNGEKKHYKKITIPIFRLVLQYCAPQLCVPYTLFYRYPFSLLSSGWFVISVCGFIAVREVVRVCGKLM